MKSIFDIMLIIFTTLTMFVCMVFFSQEVIVQNQAIHLRNRVLEIIEIEGGYTLEAEVEINDLISNFKNETEVVFTKNGKLEYGEKVTFEVIVMYERKLPFSDSTMVRYGITGEYYNINVE